MITEDKKNTLINIFLVIIVITIFLTILYFLSYGIFEIGEELTCKDFDSYGYETIIKDNKCLLIMEDNTFYPASNFDISVIKKPKTKGEEQ